MRDLAPDITRQRLLIEGRYRIDIDADAVRACLTGLAAHLGLRTYGEVLVHSPAGEGKPENQGYDAFLPLIDSGISLYVWSGKRFFALVLFSCKAFDSARALDFIRGYLDSDELESRSF
jgi:hypothetical protein